MFLCVALSFQASVTGILHLYPDNTLKVFVRVRNRNDMLQCAVPPLPNFKSLFASSRYEDMRLI
jgi:hypothetical protein